MDQITLGLDPLPKKTRKKVFLEEMHQCVQWGALVALVQPHARGAHQALGARPAEADVWGDAGYQGVDKREELRTASAPMSSTRCASSNSSLATPGAGIAGWPTIQRD